MSPRTFASFFTALVLGLGLCPEARAEQCVVLGDSLTKEYEVEFPALFPANPASWDSRNWIEILHERRNAWFDLGTFRAYADVRLTGHEHNWAFPGVTTTGIRERLEKEYWANYFWWIRELEGQIEDQAERVVIFAGGNDVDSYYGPIYNGTAPAAYINATRDNLKWIVDYVRGVKSSIPIVLVSVPHLGCTPEIQAQHPTDAVKTGRVTAALDSLNSQLAAFAQSRGIAFVPGVYELTKNMITEPFIIGGREFIREADADSRPEYVFSGDGFHPATSAHGKIAQMVIEAFVARYPAKQITPMTDREIVEDILGLQANRPFEEWIATQNVPEGAAGLEDDPDGDGLSNAVEFALEAGQAGTRNPAWMQPDGGGGWTFRLREGAQNWAEIRLQQSADLMQWNAAPAEALIQNPDGSLTYVPGPDGRKFVRLQVRAW